MSSINQLANTKLIPNPLWSYASYTYAWSMWALSAADVSALAAADDISQVNNWVPTTVDTLTNPEKRTVNTSFVVAEDSGLYPRYRVPGFPVNYNIQSVEFDTLFSPSKKFRSSNSISGTVKIIEPYGITFIESLMAAYYDPATDSYLPYTQAPYMLQLEFFGYDDNGNRISPTVASQVKKRFPIRILSMKMQLTKAGAEYDISFTGWGLQAFDTQYGVLPKPFTVKGATVGEILSDLETQLNQHYVNDQKNGKHATYADQYKFKIDPTLAASTISTVANKNITLAQADSVSSTLDFSKKTINLPKDTSILAIIDRIFAQSTYLTQAQLQLGSQTSPATNSNPANQGKPVVICKTQASVQVQGVQNTVGSAPITAANGKLVDPQRNKFPFLITYYIGPYVSYKGESPWAGVLPDTSLLSIKRYDYLYTGKNIDVIDFKVNFDMTYYNAVLGYTDAIAGSTPNLNSSADTPLADQGTTTIVPSILSLGYNVFSSTPNITPAQYKYVVANSNLTAGGGIAGDPDAQKGMDLLSSIYSQQLGDNLSVTLEINGDPTLIKQDDWLYVQDPGINNDYTNWSTVSQYDFYQSYGHVRTDVGDVAVTLNLNTPIDIDLDVGAQYGGNAGLVYPQAGSRPSKFSGQYFILGIKNTFKNGKFTQVLTLKRYINVDLTNAYYSQGAQNITTTGGTNTNGSTNNINGANATNSTPNVPPANQPASNATQGRPGTGPITFHY